MSHGVTDLHCPHCHKHQFTVWNAFWQGSGRSDLPLECPNCGKLSTLESKSATIANVSMVATLLFVVFSLPSFFDSSRGNEAITVFVALTATVIVRYFVIKRFGLLKKIDYKTALADTRESLLLVDVGAELKRLNDDKKANFTVLFEPKDDRYLSLYCRKGMIVIELAFLPENIEEKLGDKFKHAVMQAGAKIRAFDNNRVRGLEADLGTNLEAASGKVQKIFCNVFDLKPEAKIRIMRD